MRKKTKRQETDSGRRKFIRVNTIVYFFAAVTFVVFGTLFSTGFSGKATPVNSSVAASSSSPQILGLGDSVMSGSNCDCSGIPQILAARIGGKSRNDAVAGYTSAQTLQQINQNKQVIADVEASNIILLAVGANDVATIQKPANSSGDQEDFNVTSSDPSFVSAVANIKAIVSKIKSIRKNKPTQIVLFGYWNVGLDGIQARLQESTDSIAWSRQLSRYFNASLSNIAVQNNVIFYNTSFLLEDKRGISKLLAADGDHLNSIGTQTLVSKIPVQQK